MSIDITEDTTETHEVFDLETAEELKNAPEAKFDQPYLPRGKIPGILKSVELGNSKAGNQMLTWTFAVASGYAEGREIKDYSLTNKPYNIRKHVDALNMEAEENGKYAYTHPKHQGLKCTLHIIDDKRGDGRADLKAVLPPSVDEELSF